ncbi:MAG: TIGR03067 domain-containing protein [Planctomycetaceae bacterium]|nr:TIGR03067 domain-containing protein [Planctomycetaceae bacterium]
MRTKIGLCLVAAVAQLICAGNVMGRAPELDPLQGKWQVVELVIDGNVIPPEQIRYKLPSGGKIDVIDNAFIFKSPSDGQQHARTFQVDATRFPKQIFLTSDHGPVQGIYEIRGGQLLLCTSDPLRPGVPTEFAAPKGTGRMLMVMGRPEAIAKVGGGPTTVATPVASTKPSITLPAPPTSGVTQPPTAVPASSVSTSVVNTVPPPLRVITDTELAQKLVGMWKHVDGEGVLYVTLNANGSFTTQREFQDTQTFNRVFTNTFVSVGNWSVAKGALVLQIKSSWRPERVNQMINVQVRSINSKEVVYVDQLGRSSRDVRVQ